MKIRLVLVTGEVKEYDRKNYGFGWKERWLEIHSLPFKPQSESIKFLTPRENVKFVEVKGND